MALNGFVYDISNQQTQKSKCLMDSQVMIQLWLNTIGLFEYLNIFTRDFFFLIKHDQKW